MNATFNNRAARQLSVINYPLSIKKRLSFKKGSLFICWIICQYSVVSSNGAVDESTTLPSSHFNTRAGNRLMRP